MEPSTSLNIPKTDKVPPKMLTAGLSQMLVDQESQERTFENASAREDSADEKKEEESETPSEANLVPEMSNLLKFDFQSL